MTRAITPRRPRTRTLFRARMRSEGDARDIAIRDISSGGMQIEHPMPPARGVHVTIETGHQIFSGRVVWSHGDRFGIVADDPLNVQAVIRQSSPKVASISRGEMDAHRKAVRSHAAAHRADASQSQSRMMQYAVFVSTFGLVAYFAANEVQAMFQTVIAALSFH